MIDAILLVPGVPVVLFVILLALGRFEAVVAPDVDSRESPPGGPVADGRPADGVVEAAVSEDVDHSRAA